MSTINDQINDEEMERRMRTMEPAEEAETPNLVHAIRGSNPTHIIEDDMAELEKSFEDAWVCGRGISKTELIKEYFKALGLDLGDVLDNYVQEIKPKPPKEKTKEDFIKLHEAAHKRTLKNLRRAAQWQGKR